jgi:hypothetical protein
MTSAAAVSGDLVTTAVTKSPVNPVGRSQARDLTGHSSRKIA